MASVESFVVFFPRHTTLAGPTSFGAPALDVSRFGGAQILAWHGELVPLASERWVKIHLEESLDGIVWPTNARTTYLLTPNTEKFFSIGFRLRWFRVRLELGPAGAGDIMATCWVEGIMRAGGAGPREWGTPVPQAEGKALDVAAEPDPGDRLYGVRDVPAPGPGK